MKTSLYKKAIKLILFFGLAALLGFFMSGHCSIFDKSHASPSSSSPIPEAVQSTAIGAPISYADAVALAAPGVVSIKTTQEIAVEPNPLLQDQFFRYFFGEMLPENGAPGQGQEAPMKEILRGLGSGVIISEKGYVLTNNHVIKKADSVIVTLADGRTAEGKVVGSDPDTELAVLKINLDKLPVIKIGVSKKLRVGDVVLAIGNPFGFDKTVTQGIVSATEREIGFLGSLIQTDAAINPGNSGGALIDAMGYLVGINTAIYTRNGGNQGIGFAIPIDRAMEIMGQLVSGKPILRGYLGILMQALNPELRNLIDYKEGEGVYVRAVVQRSPAQKAGILEGDLILKINNVVIKDEKMALSLIKGLKPGENYSVEIFRKGERINFIVTLERRK